MFNTFKKLLLGKTIKNLLFYYLSALKKILSARVYPQNANDIPGVKKYTKFQLNSFNSFVLSSGHLHGLSKTFLKLFIHNESHYEIKTYQVTKKWMLIFQLSGIIDFANKITNQSLFQCFYLCCEQKIRICLFYSQIEK